MENEKPIAATILTAVVVAIAVWATVGAPPPHPQDGVKRVFANRRWLQIKNVCFFNSLWSDAMRNEDQKIHRDDLAEIWRHAEQRRSLELFAWIKDYFREQRSRARALKPGPLKQPAMSR
jgi:hypothetical protein